MKVVLIGGLGFIGKHVIRKIGLQNDLVIFTDPQGAKESKSFVDKHKLRVEIGDITERDSIVEFLRKDRPSCVVHLAGLTGITKCEANPSLAYSLNVLGTYNVVMGCVASSAKLVFISSREVYGETRTERTPESDELQPNNLYGLTKLLAEQIVLWAAKKHKLDYTILRITNAYGPEGDQYGVQVIVRNALIGAKIPIIGGKQVMNLIYVEDAAEAIRRCLSDPRSSKEVFNVGSHDSVSVEEVLKTICEMVNVKPEAERLPMRTGETMTFRPSIEKLEKVLGYSPPTSLNVGLSRTIEWYKSGLPRSKEHKPLING